MKKFMLCLITIVNMICAQSLTDSLKAYYPFRGNTNDESGNGFNAVNYGAFPVPDRYSVENSAYIFNNLAYMMIGNPVPAELRIQNEMTLSAWIYLTSYPGSTTLGLIVGSQTDYTTSGASIFIDGRTNSDGQPCPPGHIHFQIGDGSWHVTNSNSVVPLNQWVLITATRKANEAGKIYYNNVLQPSTSASWNGTVTYSSAWMMMGRQQDYPNRYFNGKMDEVRIYNRALTETEVKMLYANYNPPQGLNGFAEEGRNKLWWDMSGYAEIQKIKIYRNSLFYDEIAVDGPDDSLFFDNDVIPGTNYEYSVSSVDGSGNESIKTNPVYVTAAEITFTDISAGLPGLFGSSSAWGDYDNDGDVDILLSGYNNSEGYITRIYRNDSGVFTDINAGLSNIVQGSVDWVDYDNDGDLDLLLTGNSIAGLITKIYKNESGIFTDINAGLPGISNCSVDWADYDNDCDIDILLSGSYGTGYITRIYRNDSGSFTDINAGLPDLTYSSVDWGDYDNDGDPDILITGITYAPLRISRVYRNDSGVFTDINAGLTGVFIGSAEWGDLDNDGDLDIALTGDSGPGFVFKIYRNDSGIFSGSDAEPSGFTKGTVDWGDYDNDGDLDILLNGATVYGSPFDPVTRIYRNDSGVFTNINAGLSGVHWGASSWGDYDNDGDLDLVLTGDTTAEYLSKIYRNNSVVPNNEPNAPANLRCALKDTDLIINWDAATDTETPQEGLTYNINVDNNGVCKNPSMSDDLTGYRKIVKMGNASQNDSYSLNTAFFKVPALPQDLQKLTVKVQTVDNCFAGSQFAAADTTLATRDLDLINFSEMTASDVLSWEYLFTDSLSNYQIQIDDDINFGSPIGETITVNKKADITKAYYGIALNVLADFDSLVSNTRYYWRIKPNYIYRLSRYSVVPSSFIYDPVYSAPSPVAISVEGNYVTLTWGTGKEAEKGMLYNIYSSDDPHAAFPSGWTLVNSVTGTSYVLSSTVRKKFYCVTAAGIVK